MDIFMEAINNMPEDVMQAKYDSGIGSQSRPKQTRSHAPFDKTIDLHGCTKKEAITVLRNALSRAKGKRLKILVITGRGNNSECGISVLREAVNDYLDTAGSLYIRGFRLASPKNGGDGAFEIVTK